MVDINYYDVNGRPQNTGLMQSILAIFGDGENPPEVQQKIAQVLRSKGLRPDGGDWDKWDIPALVRDIQAAVPEYKTPSQAFNIIKNAGNYTPPPAAITGDQIMAAANDPAKLQALGNEGAAYAQNESAKLSAMLAPPSPAPATPSGAVVAPAAAGSPTTAAGGTGATGGWNQDYATQWGRLFGFLGENEIATGGLLNQRVAAAGKQDMYQQAMADANAGKGIDIEAAIDAEIERQKNAPDYGMLLKTYKDPKPFSMENYQADPGYQFRLSEGLKGIDRAAAARGKFFSGEALKGAADYSGKMASEEYGSAYDRYNNDYNIGYQKFGNDQNSLYSRLMGVAGMGAGTTSTAVNANSQNADALGSIYGQAANAKAGATLANGSNFSSMLGGLSQNLGKSQYAPSTYGTYQTQGALPWQKPGATYPIY